MRSAEARRDTTPIGFRDGGDRRAADAARLSHREGRRRALVRRRRAAVALALVGIGTIAGALVLARGGEEPKPEPSRGTAGAAAAAPPSARAVEREAAPTARAPRVRPRAPGRAGTLVAVPGASGVLGAGGPITRFVVEVEGGLRIDRGKFVRTVERALDHRRGWSRLQGISFQRVAGGQVAFSITLARPATTDDLCLPLRTNGIFSCYMDGRAVLNFDRWRRGAATYAGDLASYRTYMVNHEVGHALGYGHAGCPAPGALAPIMVQQTKGVEPCRPNPWPRR